MSTDSAQPPRTHLLRAVTLLVIAALVLSAVASVPLVESTQQPPSSGSADDGDSIESFEAEFAPAKPEDPNDVDVRWNLSAGADDVRTVRVEFTNESGEPINVYKPNDTAVPNPFNVSERAQRHRDTDISVDDLSTVELTLKIPPGHCDRVDGVKVFVDDANGSAGDPVVERSANCSGSPSGGFAVSIQEYDAELTAGDTGNATAVVRNTAEAEENQTVRFLVNGTEVDRTNVTLTANESEMLNFSYGTDESDVGDLEIAVESEDDAASRTVTVGELPVFAVQITDYDEQVAAGEAVNVTAAVQNTASTEVSQDVRFVVNGTVTDRTNVTLAANASETRTFSTATDESDVGELAIAVESEDDAATRTTTVTEPPTFAVRIVDHDDTVRVGQPVNVTAEIANTAASQESQDVRFVVNGSVIERTNLTLSPGENETMTFSVGTNETDAGHLGVAVESEDDRATRTVSVKRPALFAVTIEDAPDRVAAGETVSVTALIENTGEYAGVQPITLTDFDDGVVATRENLSLSPGASRTVTLQWSTGTDDVGNGTIDVSSDNETATTGLVITDPVVDSVTATLAESVVREAGETTVTAEATYTDGSTRTVTDSATFSVDNTSVATVSDDGTVTAQRPGSVDIEAAFENETDTATLTVDPAEESSGTDDSSSNDDSSSDDAGSEDPSGDSDDTSDTGTPGDTDDSTDDDSGSDDEGTDDGPRDDPTDGDPASDGPADDPSEPESTNSPSDSNEDGQTTVALIPVLGLLVLPPLALLNREWWFSG